MKLQVEGEVGFCGFMNILAQEITKIAANFLCSRDFMSCKLSFVLQKDAEFIDYGFDEVFKRIVPCHNCQKPLRKSVMSYKRAEIIPIEPMRMNREPTMVLKVTSLSPRHERMNEPEPRTRAHHAALPVATPRTMIG